METIQVHDLIIVDRRFRLLRHRRLSAGHRDTRIREQVLLEVVRDWFSKQNYESFRPEPPRQRADLQRIPRPGFARELLVRHDWTIASVVTEPATPSQAAASA